MALTGEQAYALAKRYTDDQLNSGIFVGYVTNGGAMPTQRPDGSALKNEDYSRPLATSTFPFSIGTLTFENRAAKAIFFNNIWIIDPGAIQDTSETMLKSPVKECEDANAAKQSEVNILLKKRTQQLKFTNNTLSTGSWSIDHNLDDRPEVKVLDEDGAEVIVDLEYSTNNTIVIKVAGATLGKTYTAYIN